MQSNLLKGLGAAVFVSMLSACATTYPVVAVNDQTGERFYGTATSTPGTSRFQISSAAGVTCDGTYKATVVSDYTTGTSTQGRMSCSDGRQGQWVTAGTARGGQGEGQLGGDKLKLYYGQFASNQQIE